MSEKKDVDQMSFEEAIAELESIVALLEEGKVALQKSVELYERGMALKRRCDEILDSAQLKIMQISSDKITEVAGA